MTNSFFDDILKKMFNIKSFKAVGRRATRTKRQDQVTEQVKKLLSDTDQKLILMARG